MAWDSGKACVYKTQDRHVAESATNKGSVCAQAEAAKSQPAAGRHSQHSALLWGQKECRALIVLDFDKRQSALCLWEELAENLGRSVS